MRSESSGSVRITFPAFSRDELIDRLRGGVQSLVGELPVTRVVLFGSWATGRATAFSDIDLLVVYAGPSQEDAFHTVHRCMGVRALEPHVYTEEEAEKVDETLRGMTRRSIEIYSVRSADVHASRS